MANSLLAQEPAKPRAAVPSEPTQQAATALVAQVYKADYDRAKTAEQKLALAKKLLHEGRATKDDPVGRYVLLRIARDIAAQQGSLDTAIAAISELAAGYEVDAASMRVEAASLVRKTLKTPKEHGTFVGLVGQQLQAALSLDDYPNAKALSGLAIASAREARSGELLKQATKRQSEIEQLAAEFAKAEEARLVLQDKPTDPDANLAVGRFACLAKGDFERGIPLLALGSDKPLQALALLELAEKPDAAKLGDAWWDYSESLADRSQELSRLRAAGWYRMALPSLSGLAKAKVERRLEETAKLAPLPTPTSSGEKQPKPGTVLVHETKQWTWQGAKESFARATENTFTAGMGDRPDGVGGASAGAVLSNVKNLKISVVTAGAFKRFDDNSFAGFFVDYRTPKGYTKRVALSFSFHYAKRWDVAPHWGTRKLPDAIVDVGRFPAYNLDLAKFAPDDWDGTVYFTLHCQNAGRGVSLAAKIEQKVERLSP